MTLSFGKKTAEALDSRRRIRVEGFLEIRVERAGPESAPLHRAEDLYITDRVQAEALIGMVQTRVERNGSIEQERRYYLSSTRLDARAFAAAVRAHWGIENRLHWVLDVAFHDDLARLRSLNGPQNMAIVKHMAMNLVRNPKDRHSLKVRRKLANLNPNYLETLIRQKAALT
jgi:predicted transposase YbfD/YdcC